MICMEGVISNKKETKENEIVARPVERDRTDVGTAWSLDDLLKVHDFVWVVYRCEHESHAGSIAILVGARFLGVFFSRLFQEVFQFVVS